MQNKKERNYPLQSEKEQCNWIAPGYSFGKSFCDNFTICLVYRRKRDISIDPPKSAAQQTWEQVDQTVVHRYLSYWISAYKAYQPFVGLYKTYQGNVGDFLRLSPFSLTYFKSIIQRVNSSYLLYYIYISDEELTQYNRIFSRALFLEREIFHFQGGRRLRVIMTKQLGTMPEAFENNTAENHGQ